MREKALKLLGLMRRANAIQIGEDKTGAAVKAGKAKLLLLAADSWCRCRFVRRNCRSTSA